MARGSWGREGSSIQIQLQGGGVSLITEGSWGSEGSSQSDLGSTMG